MVYMAGDNNLSTAGDKDLWEMRQVGSTEEVNLVVQFDNEGDHGTNRYLVQKGGIDDRVHAMGETDCGAPEVLSDFICWTAENYPAERYALVLWSHGSAWEPAEIDRVARSVGAKDYSAREAAERSASPLGKAFFRSSMARIFSLPSPLERAICVDDGSGHSLDTIELGKILEGAVQALGRPIDLLGMDACLMSNLEVAYQAKKFVRYIVASEESEPNDGWPYDRILKDLVAHPDQSTATLAGRIVRYYVQSYLDRDYTGPVTQTALDLAKVDRAAQSMDLLAEALIGCMPEAKMHMWMAQHKSARFWHNTLWDVKHFSEELGKASQEPAVSQAIGEVQARFKPGRGRFVIAEGHNGASVERCGGVSIYLPALTKVSQFYGELDFAGERRWPALLQAYQA
jgi:hypothetical protein